MNMKVTGDEMHILPILPINDVDQHLGTTNYLLRFLDPTSRPPGQIGMISWGALREGLNTEKAFFNEKIQDESLSQYDADRINEILGKIEIALERIAV